MDKSDEARHFFQRAHYEANRYGDDDWVFLRELVQNSRDAGASDIQFTFHQESGQESLVCQDNGTGMSKSDLEIYLLNLYSSSKEPKKTAGPEGLEHLGFFGVGFWSVLRFNPCRIEVISKKKDTVCGIAILPEKGSVDEIPGEWDSPFSQGTQIKLTREKDEKDYPESNNLIREKLLHYARYIQPLGPIAINNIHLTFNGDKLNETFCEKTALKQVNKPTYGFYINLAEQASFHLYHCGLLIHSCSSMDELFLNRTSAPLVFNPEIRLNLQHAIPLMDRKTVYEEPAVTRIMEIVDKACIDIQEKMIKSSFPLGFKGHWVKFKQNKLKKVALFAIISFVFLLAAWSLFKPPTSLLPIPPEMRDLTSIVLASPSADYKPEQRNNWSFQYRRRPPYVASRESSGDKSLDAPSNELILFSLGTLNPKTLSANPQSAWQDLSNQAPLFKSKNLLFLDLKMSVRPTRPSDSPFQLPRPDGYFLLGKTTVKLSDTLFTEIRWDKSGTAFAQFENSGELHYSLQKADLAVTRSEPGLLDLSSLSLPPEILIFTEEHMAKTTSEKVKELRSFFKTNFHYTLPSNFKTPTRNSSKKQTWLQSLIQKEGGDCDELNGLGAQILAYWGIPAKLHYGLVGNNGYAESELHAWITYGTQPEKFLDLTAPVRDFRDTVPPEAVTTRQPQGSDKITVKTGQSKRSTKHLWPGIIASILGFLFVIALVLWVRRGGTSKKDLIPPSQMAEMLNFQMEHSVDDRLSLFFRPFFSTVSGKTLCFNDFYRMSPNKFLLVNTQQKAFKKIKNAALLVIDKAHPVFSALNPYLPEFFDLELTTEPSSPYPYLSNFFHTMAPDWKLFIQVGRKGFRYYQLPLAGEGFGKKQIVLGALSIPLDIREQSASRRQINDFFLHLLTLTKEV